MVYLKYIKLTKLIEVTTTTQKQIKIQVSITRKYSQQQATDQPMEQSELK